MGTKAAIKFSHFGINVTDVALMKDFYTGLMGLTETDHGELPNGMQLVFLSSDPTEHHQVVLVAGRPEETPFNVVQQISFRVESLDELKAVHARLAEYGVPGALPLNHGNAWSLYFADPEGNTIELFADAPWHTPQPVADAFDIEKPTAEIMRETEAFCRGRDGFMLREDWAAELAAKLSNNA